MCQITCHLICSKFDPRLFQTTKNFIQTTPLKFRKYNTEFREYMYLFFISSMSFLNICLRRKSYSFAQNQACHAMQLFKVAEDLGYCSILHTINKPYAENSLGFFFTGLGCATRTLILISKLNFFNADIS